MNISEQIRNYRKSVGLTQEQVANAWEFLPRPLISGKKEILIQISLHYRHLPDYYRWI